LQDESQPQETAAKRNFHAKKIRPAICGNFIPQIAMVPQTIGPADNCGEAIDLHFN
jgi:hypothetical protein